MSPSDAATETRTRPRVVGEREREILEAALDVLADVGYDRLTMDAVATAARASKATLYRRWAAKPELVIEALLSTKPMPEPVDSGTLRGDLLAMFCATGGLTDARQTAVMSSVITAIGRDPEFAAAFRRDFIGPRAEQVVLVFRRAQHRGEVHPDVDVDLIATALPGIVLHRRFFLGEVPDEALVVQVVDHLVLPAATHGPLLPHSPADTTTDMKDAP
ncbi:TetR/AcrR family transcriptional regulator [uncultured Nocardioides sp.]|uniref:TetR/AcrR family transcriptional regulator n=1 Tax=uncultured Nocardioides sp. TaxID=198441 RepID=UPI0026377533|nr:TetR/AcrR family transcriptional regulator [uncultured Nocardioides sp.]